jgi:transposase
VAFRETRSARPERCSRGSRVAHRPEDRCRSAIDRAILKPGRPRKHPDAIYADRGYDSEAIRQSLRSQGIKPVIARRGIDHGSSLGRIRWVVERTISWFKGLRRLRIRYDRSGDVQDAWNRLAASVLCYRVAIRWGLCHG